MSTPKAAAASGAGGGGGGGGGGGNGGGVSAVALCGNATSGSSFLIGEETVKPSGINERKRRASDEISLDSSTKASESGIVDDLQAVRDDNDDDDDDEDDKLPSGHEYDTERLKAFNMFVRLFVDENLDRMVPISKQPKDKIQAILEACDRQFPEFHERSRKRIRTYLKSCRRMRRSKEQNGWEPASAVQQLSNSGVLGGVGGSSGGGNIGGNNNSNNSNSNNSNSSNNNNNNSSSNNNSGTGAGGNGSGGCATPSGQNANSQNTAHQLSSANQAQSQSQTGSHDRSVVSSTGNDFIRHQPPTFRPPPEFHPPFFPNSNGIFRPGFTTGYQHPAHHHPPVIQHTPIQHNSVQNGPTDLSMKKQNSKNQLSPSEVATIKQLIAGYRESAAFLYRSADELEQLLLQQN
ncbi:Hypothetical predicted protein [Octopus vulgaris]|uniref:Nucleolar protein 4 helical domain-containing protein n=1 Tax=Octopus vulgaris TaxID=6645 RepID=A0AA36B1H9_OCTVU|nr:Hypothetical predicted protein [Octopus vulgaris]